MRADWGRAPAGLNQIGRSYLEKNKSGAFFDGVWAVRLGSSGLLRPKREISMKKKTYRKLQIGVAGLAGAMLFASFQGFAQDNSAALKADALSAAWSGMVKDATVVDWEGNVLQEGSNGYTCLPTPPMLSGTAPMCMDSEWMKWADAWANKKEYAAETLGISYMLSGDEGASNIDPYAEGPTDDNEWIEEGAHLMVLAPAALLETYPTDPHNGGPYVMWKGTPYAHLMVPIGARD